MRCSSSISSSAAILKELLTNEPALPLEIDRSAREVVTEIGNILLNACLGTFGNLLKVQVSFSVPHLTLDTLESVVSSIAVDRQGLRYALIVHSHFRLREQQPDRLSGHRARRGLDRAADPRARAAGTRAALGDGDDVSLDRREAAERAVALVDAEAAAGPRSPPIASSA